MSDGAAAAEMSNETGLTERRYWAFLSYPHVDKRAAEKLHRFLERYRFPRGLVTEEDAEQPVPRRFYPVFRDREELQTGDDLHASLVDALHRSRSLIVMCSPATGESKWIPVEIAEYQSAPGPGPTLYAVSPQAPDPFDAATCLPTGIVGEKVPLAADCRDSGDGFRDAALKTMATVVGVRFDDLKRRDARRRHRRTAVAAAVAFAIAAVLLTLTLIAVSARNEAQYQESIARSQFLSATAGSLDERDTAILVGLEAWRIAETDEAHAALVDLVLSRDLHAYLRLEQGGDVSSLAVGPDSLLIGAGERGQLQAWNPLSRETAWDMTGVHTGDVIELATSPDTSRMVTGDADGAVVSWTLEPTPKVAGAIGGDGVKVTSVAIDDDGVIAFAREDRSVFVWSQKGVRAIPAYHLAPVDDLLIDRGGSRLLTFGGDGVVAGWDLEAMTLDWSTPTLRHPQAAADASPDGTMVASVGLNGTVWNLGDEELSRALDIETINVATDVVVGGGGSYLVIGDQAGAVSLYDSKTGEMWAADDVHAGPTLSVALVPIDSFENIASSGVGDGAAIQLLDGFPDLGVEVSVGWVDMGALVGRFVVTASNDTTTTLESTEIIGEVGHSPARDKVTVDGPVVAVSGWETTDLFGVLSEGEVGKLWRVAQDSGHLEEVLELSDPVSALAVDPAGATVAVAHDQTIRLFSVPDLSQILTIEGDAPFEAMQFSASGERLLAASDDNVVAVYDIDDGALVGTERASPSDVMAANATGSVIAWTDVYSRIHVWRPDSGTSPSEHGGHESSVRGMAFSDDGGLLASVGDEGTVRIWEPNSMTLIGEFDLPTFVVEGVTFSRDDYLIVFDYDHTLFRLDLSTESIKRTACEIVDRNMSEDEWRRFGDGGPAVEHCEPRVVAPETRIGDVDPDWIAVPGEPPPASGSFATSNYGSIRTWVPDGWTLEEPELAAGIATWVRVSDDHERFLAEEGVGFEVLRFGNESSENLHLRRLVDSAIDEWAPGTCAWMSNRHFANPSISGTATILNGCSDAAPGQIWIAARADDERGDNGPVVLIDATFGEDSRAIIARIMNELVLAV